MNNLKKLTKKIFVGAFSLGYFLFLSSFALPLINWSLGPSCNIMLTRIALLIQIIGVLSALPDFLDQQKFDNLEIAYQDFKNVIHSDMTEATRSFYKMELNYPPKGITGWVMFFAKFHLFLGFLSYWIFFMIDYVLVIKIERGESSITAWVGIILFLLLFVGYIVMLVYKLRKRTNARFYKQIIAPIDERMVVLALPLALIYSYILRPVIWFIRKLSNLSLRELLIKYTFPIVLFGTFLEFVATYF